MATRTPVLLGTGWTLIYNAASVGDFVGLLMQTGGAADAIIHFATSTPAAGDGGIIPDGGISVNMTQASGIKLYGRSPSGTATVCLTTNAGALAGNAIVQGTPIPACVIASDGVLLPIDSLAQTLGYTGANLTTVTVSYGGRTYVQTLTWTGTNLTDVSAWVKQ